jgi:hypothetical protein
MRIQVGDPDLLPELLQFLDARVDFVPAAAGAGEADVGVLGSFADGGRAELDSHLELWRAAHPQTTVDVVPPRVEPPDVAAGSGAVVHRRWSGRTWLNRRCGRDARRVDSR